MDIIHTIIHWWIEIILIIPLSFMSCLIAKVTIDFIRYRYKLSKISKGQSYAYRLKSDPFKESKHIYAEILDCQDGYVSFVSEGKEFSLSTSKFLGRFEIMKDGYLLES